jgi:hypothetical protein
VKLSNIEQRSGTLKAMLFLVSARIIVVQLVQSAVPSRCSRQSRLLAPVSTPARSRQSQLSNLRTVALTPPVRFAQMGSQLPMPPLSGFLFHKNDVSVGLIRYHFPASHKACQNRGLGSALRQEHETVTFIGLGSTPICAIHCTFPFMTYFNCCCRFSEIVFQEKAKELVHPTTARTARSFCNLSIYRHGDGRAHPAPN